MTSENSEYRQYQVAVEYDSTRVGEIIGAGFDKKEGLQIVGLGGAFDLSGRGYVLDAHFFYIGPEEDANTFADRMRETGLAKAIHVDPVSDRLS